MKQKDILYLGSKSYSRKMLLTEAQIAFEVIPQDADEMQCDWNLPLEQAVASIARHKMHHVILPKMAQEKGECFVLTADTLSIDADGTLNGKPLDVDDAIAKITRNRGKSHKLATAFCIEKKRFVDGNWQTQECIEQVVCAQYQFDIPDAWIDVYLKKSLGLSASGAVAVEQFGSQFLKVVEGSYSAIIGLPLFEVREALESLAFFE